MQKRVFLILDKMIILIGLRNTLLKCSCWYCWNEIPVQRKGNEWFSIEKTKCSGLQSGELIQFQMLSQTRNKKEPIYILLIVWLIIVNHHLLAYAWTS